VLPAVTASIADSLDIAKLIAPPLPLGSLPFLADFVPQDQAVPASAAVRLATARQIALPLLLAAALVLQSCASSKTHTSKHADFIVYLLLLALMDIRPALSFRCNETGHRKADCPN
jgi:hypothetical protein